MFDEYLDMEYLNKAFSAKTSEYEELNKELNEYLIYKLENIEESLDEIINRFLYLYLWNINGLKSYRSELINTFAKFMIKYKRIELLNIILHFYDVCNCVKTSLESGIEQKEINFMDLGFGYVYPKGLRIFITNEDKLKHDKIIKNILKEFIINKDIEKENENKDYIYYKYNYDSSRSVISVEIRNKKLAPKQRQEYTISNRSLKYLEESIENIIRRTRRNTSSFQNLYKKVKKLIETRLNDPRCIIDIIPFGSVTQLTYNINSDLEISILTDNFNDDLFNEILEILKIKFPNAFSRYTSRTRMIRFSDKEVTVELMFNNYLAIINSDLILRYCSFDTRIAIMINVIKDWSKNLEINGNSKHYLSSYCLTLMVIFFCQKVFQIVPVLQNKNKSRDLFLRENNNIKNHYLIDEIHEIDLSNFQSADYSVAELVYNFFYFYLYVFNEIEYAIDISEVKYVYREDCISFIDGNCANDKPVYWIVDPYDYSYNPAHYMKSRSSQHRNFIEEMKKAMDNIKEGRLIFIKN
jgi:hypothetical protein